MALADSATWPGVIPPHSDPALSTCLERAAALREGVEEARVPKRKEE